MNSYEIAEYILAGINNDFTETVVLADQKAPRPKTFPFGSMKITLPYIAETGHDIEETEKVASPGPFDYDIKYINKQIPDMTISITTIGKTEMTASELAYKLHDWFESTGIYYLDDQYIAVIDVLDISDRATFLQGDYEYRFGFDVRLRYTRVIERTVETIETFEIKEDN